MLYINCKKVRYDLFFWPSIEGERDIRVKEIADAVYK